MKFGLSKDIYNKIKNVVLKYSSYEFKIYGSRARGDFKKESDVDIAVFGNINEEDKMKILNDWIQEWAKFEVINRYIFTAIFIIVIIILIISAIRDIRRW